MFVCLMSSVKGQQVGGDICRDYMHISKISAYQMKAKS